MSNIIIVLSCFAALFLAPFLALAGARTPGYGEPALVVAPPWRDGAAIALQADVPELLATPTMLGTLVLPRNENDVRRLFENGAWFVIDAKRIAALCAI